MTPPTDLLLIAETIEGRLMPPARDLVAMAKTATAAGGTSGRLLVAGHGVAATARELSTTSGLDVFVLDHPDLRLPNPVLLATLACEAVDRIRPAMVALPHTIRGCQIAASVALHLDIPCVAGVETLRFSDSGPIFERPLFNGKLMAAIRPPSSRAVFTVAGGAFAPADDPPPAAGKVLPLEATGTEARFTPLAIMAATDDTQSIDNADVIVSAGRGVGSADNLALLDDIARILKNSAVGGSRIACDAGWLPYSRQIGETGRRVAPAVYLACGISGARQHLAGIKNARTVIAINTDPQAAIFARADYGIVEDLTRFLPLVLEKYRERFDK